MYLCIISMHFGNSMLHDLVIVLLNRGPVGKFSFMLGRDKRLHFFIFFIAKGP